MIILDIKSMYLQTDLDHFKYMNLSLDIILNETITQCNLCEIFHDEWVYTKGHKGIYGLPQTGMLVQKKSLPTSKHKIFTLPSIHHACCNTTYVWSNLLL